MSERPAAIHVFDMDGTLLHGTSASLQLARHTGDVETVIEFERLSALGALDNVEFHRRTHPLWQALGDNDIDAVFAESPWLANIRTVFADIAERGEHALVVSMSPLFFVQRLERWGAHRAFASDNPIGAPFDIGGILVNEDKVTIVRKYAADVGASLDTVVAYGDSYTDVPLFRSGVRSVAVNATDDVSALATGHYRGTNLLDAYQLGRALL